MGLAADCAPARDRVGRADVRPLAEIGLAKDDGSGGAQPRDQRRVAIGDVVRKREATGGRRQRARGFDIVLQEYRLSGERATLSARVDPPCLRHRGGIERDDRMKLRVEALHARNSGGRSRLCSPSVDRLGCGGGGGHDRNRQSEPVDRSGSHAHHSHPFIGQRGASNASSVPSPLPVFCRCG